MSRPDCFVVGFFKCGTTSLYKMLMQHRNILVSKEKENLFWGNVGLYKKGISWYEKTYYDFPKNIEDKVIEVNPAMTEIPGTAKRLSQYYSRETPIVFMLRNPVDILYSAFKYDISSGLGSLRRTWYCKKHSFSVGFEHYIMQHKNIEINKYKHRYSCWIKEYQKYFDNIKVIFLEDVVSDADKVYSEIIDFFGLEKDNNVEINIKENVSDFLPRYPLLNKVDWEMRILKRWLREGGGEYGIIYKLLDIFEIKIRNICMNTQIKDISEMDIHTRKKLEKFFRSEKRVIEKIIGKELCNIWWED